MSERKGAWRRGLSPLIGAVILVSFVMIVAGIMTGFIQSFTKSNVGAVKNETDARIECSYAAIFITEAIFDDANDEVEIEVSNSGTVDLDNVSIHVFKDVQVTNSTFITNLEVQGAKTGTVTYKKGEQPDKVRAVSRQCPAVADEETRFATR